MVEFKAELSSEEDEKLSSEEFEYDKIRLVAIA